MCVFNKFDIQALLVDAQLSHLLVFRNSIQ